MTVDRGRLLAHLKAKAEHRSLIIHAVYAGLATAITRGDFDTRKEGD